MDTLSIVVWFGATLVFVLGPIIIVHEIGHFLAAKRAGVRVEEFGIGFPPRLVTVAQERGTMQVGNVELVIPGRTKLPLDLKRGKWVQALARRQEDGTLHLLRVTQEADTGPADAVVQGTDDGIAVRGPLTSFEPGTRYSLNLLPIGGFVRMSGEEDPSDPRSLAAQPKRWRLTVLLAGALLNLVTAFLLLTAAYATGTPERFFAHVDHVEPGLAAAEAGLEPGDVVVAVDGTVLSEGITQLRDIIERSSGQAMHMQLLREGELLELTASPRDVEGVGFLGIGMRDWPDPDSVVRYPLPRAAAGAASDLAYSVAALVRLPRLLAQGQVTLAEVRPQSAVGINAMLTFALQQSLEWRLAYPALSISALVSLAVGLSNLLPLPALDGGRALFVLLEAIRGRRINPELEMRIHLAGVVVLLALVAVVMVQDIVDPYIAWSLLRR